MNDTARAANYVIDLGAPPSLGVAGSTSRFPVRRIYCVGRNYAEHAREMGHDPDREPPFFFMKPATSIVNNGATLGYPGRLEGCPPRDRAGRRDRQDGTRRSGRARARSRVGLRRRTRHDAARPAGRGEEAGPPVGDGQGVRRIGAVHRLAARGARSGIRNAARSGSRSTARASKPAISRSRSGRSPSRSPICRGWSRCCRAI